MVIEVAEPRRVGRPVAKPGTVRILPSGWIRLSPDLCTAKDYEVAVDKQCKQLIIRPGGRFKLKYTRPNAQSGLLNAVTVFELLGKSPEVLAGEYVVRFLYKSKAFVVELGK